MKIVLNASNKLRKLCTYVKWKYVVLIFLFLLQGILFLPGYRLTPDQLTSHYIAMQGFDAVIAHTLQAAYSSGRICLFFHPLFCYAELLSDYFIVRLFFVSMYFFLFVVFAAYWSKLIKADVFVLMLLLFVSLQILDYNNLPPNSYNIAFTLPLLLLLCSRYAVLKLDDGLCRASNVWLLALSLALFVSYLAADYVFIFGVSMLLLEYLLAFARSEGGAAARINALVRRKKTLFDLLPLVLAGLCYFVWRRLFPPQYDGTTLAGHFNPLLVFKTALAHVLGGFSPARGDLYGMPLSVEHLSPGYVFLSACVFLCSALLAAASIYQLRGLARGRIVVAGSLFLAFFVTLPLALTPKYQQLQLEKLPAYIDSRFAYFWGVAAVAGLLCLAGSLLGEGKRRIALSAAFGLLVGTASAFSYYHNVDMCQVMLDNVAVWDGARRIATASDASGSARDGRLASRIDPLSLVPGHPGFDMESYWREYLSWYGQRRQSVLLNWNPGLFDVLPVGLKPNVMYAVARLPRRFFYRNGWYLPESWGALSRGNHAFLTFQTAPSGKDATLVFTACGMMAQNEAHQAVEIRLNGRPLQTLRMTSEFTAYYVPIPGDALQTGLAEFEFYIQNPFVPANYGSQDNRVLGLGLSNAILVR